MAEPFAADECPCDRELEVSLVDLETNEIFPEILEEGNKDNTAGGNVLCCSL